MSGTVTPLPQYVFMAWCSVKKTHRGNFTFTLPLFNYILVGTFNNTASSDKGDICYSQYGSRQNIVGMNVDGNI